MGGESQQDTQQSQTTAPGLSQAVPLSQLLTKVGNMSSDLNPNEIGALNRLQTNANAGNPYASQIGGVANNLLGGGGNYAPIATDAYNNFLSGQAATARGDYLDPNTNPFFQRAASGVADSVFNAGKAEYAGAGRDPSGAGSFLPNIADRTATALAPMFANQYNTERQNQINAQNSMFAAGGQTAGLLSNLDQSRFANMQAGITAADAANSANDWGNMQTLAIEAQRRGIPLQMLQTQLGLISPVAQAFGTTSGTSQVQKNMSPLEQFALIAGGTGNLFKSGAKGAG